MLISIFIFSIFPICSSNELVKQLNRLPKVEKYSGIFVKNGSNNSWIRQLDSPIVWTLLKFQFAILNGSFHLDFDREYDTEEFWFTADYHRGRECQQFKMLGRNGLIYDWKPISRCSPFPPPPKVHRNTFNFTMGKTILKTFVDSLNLKTFEELSQYYDVDVSFAAKTPLTTKEYFMRDWSTERYTREQLKLQDCFPHQQYVRIVKWSLKHFVENEKTKDFEIYDPILEEVCQPWENINGLNKKLAYLVVRHKIRYYWIIPKTFKSKIWFRINSTTNAYRFTTITRECAVDDYPSCDVDPLDCHFITPVTDPPRDRFEELNQDYSNISPNCEKE